MLDAAAATIVSSLSMLRPLLCFPLQPPDRWLTGYSSNNLGFFHILLQCCCCWGLPATGGGGGDGLCLYHCWLIHHENYNTSFLLVNSVGFFICFPLPITTTVAVIPSLQIFPIIPFSHLSPPFCSLLSVPTGLHADNNSARATGNYNSSVCPCFPFLPSSSSPAPF